MQQFKKLIFILLFLCINCSFADVPWFTGPLLAPAGHTTPKGHTNLEVYGIDVHTTGRYNKNGDVIDLPLFRTFLLNPIMTHGFTDWLDVQMSVPYAFNSTQDIRHNRITDVSGALGIQLIEQNGSPKKVDFRVLLQEVFPTGRYERLNPALMGTDATGLGSYLTQVGLDFQYLMQVFDTHYLRTRFILARTWGTPVHVTGLNSYGGAPDTTGTIKPGAEGVGDLAFEFTLTQKWVAVFEAYVSKGKSTRFNGTLTIASLGSPDVTIGSEGFESETLAPAIEYNFNENFGIIGGVWFSVAGKDTSYFKTYMLALNAYW